jgi:hypothetical protein
MRFLSAENSVGPIARLVFAGLILVCFAPASARAACSHYVRSNADLPKFESLVERFDTTIKLATTASEPAAPAGPERRRGCSGAFCSGQPGTPGVPAQISIARASQWAILAKHFASAVPAAGFTPEDKKTLLPIACPISIDHPPRWFCAH